MRARVIHVLAGVNGAGKSSIGGAAIRAAGGEFFNPDEVSARLRKGDPALTVATANALAWESGRRLLSRAIAQRLDYAFETTLGGRTIHGQLRQAISVGLEVRIWYVGLASPELHIARVRTRVRVGGHDIPDETIRARYNASRLNLIDLLPVATEVRVYDNSAEADPRLGLEPRPVLLLHTVEGVVRSHVALGAVPEWAKPILGSVLANN